MLLAELDIFSPSADVAPPLGTLTDTVRSSNVIFAEYSLPVKISKKPEAEAFSEGSNKMSNSSNPDISSLNLTVIPIVDKDVGKTMSSSLSSTVTVEASTLAVVKVEVRVPETSFSAASFTPSSKETYTTCWLW